MAARLFFRSCANPPFSSVPFQKHQLQFGRFGRISNIWIARKPPGFAFIEFEDSRDAEDAVRKLDGEGRVLLRQVLFYSMQRLFRPFKGLVLSRSIAGWRAEDRDLRAACF